MTFIENSFFLEQNPRDTMIYNHLRAQRATYFPSGIQTRDRVQGLSNNLYDMYYMHELGDSINLIVHRSQKQKNIKCTH